MGDFDKFINTGFSKSDRVDFGRNALKAALEIAKEEDSVFLPTNGRQILPQKMPDGWLPIDLNHRISKQLLADVVKEYLEKGKALLFRGTSLPDARIGSFHLRDEGIHTSIDVGTAIGYASIVNPLYHNIFSLGSKETRLGFVTAWEAPVDTKLWSNFHYESFEAGHQKESDRTIRDLLQDLGKIALLPVEDFQLRDIDGYQYCSIAEQKKDELLGANTLSYEAIIGKEAKQEAIYLSVPHSGLINIDQQNPKWDRWMARVQEACLRDMYECSPLEQMVERLRGYIKDGQSTEYPNLNHRANLAQQYLDSGYLQLVQDQVESRSWQFNSMPEIGKAEMPWVRSSKKIASITLSQIDYPPSVSEFVNLSDTYKEIDSFLEAWSRALEIAAPLREERKNHEDRRNISHVERLESGGGEAGKYRGGECSTPVRKESWAGSV